MWRRTDLQNMRENPPRERENSALWEGGNSLQTTLTGYIAIKELVAEGLIEI
jgi:hypothetical protein